MGKKSSVAMAWSTTFIPPTFQEAYTPFINKLNNVKKEVTIEAPELRHTFPELLIQHGQEYYVLQDQLKDLNQLEK